MALNRVAIPSPNYSSRGGTAVRLVVLHTAEGSTSIESLGSFFANPASGVSSHTGVDDKVNTVGEYVPPGYKAWTQGNANPYSVATELCAFAAWDAGQWAAHPQMVENCRLWINEECARFGIPRRRLTAPEAQSGVAGVCDHAALRGVGGGHWDVGSLVPVAPGPRRGSTRSTETRKRGEHDLYRRAAPGANGRPTPTGPCIPCRRRRRGWAAPTTTRAAPR